MTSTHYQLPLPSDFEAAQQKLDHVWGLVPRSARPLHKQYKTELDHLIARCIRYAETRSTQIAALDALNAARGLSNGAAGADGGGDAVEETPLSIVMRLLRKFSPEQSHQVMILLKIRELSDFGRLELFDELADSHHQACGGEIDEDKPHECEEIDDEEDDDGEDDEDDFDDDPERADVATRAHGIGIVESAAGAGKEES